MTTVQAVTTTSVTMGDNPDHVRPDHHAIMCPLSHEPWSQDEEGGLAAGCTTQREREGGILIMDNMATM